jgi:hypothetical protein
MATTKTVRDNPAKKKQDAKRVSLQEHEQRYQNKKATRKPVPFKGPMRYGEQVIVKRHGKDVVGMAMQKNTYSGDYNVYKYDKRGVSTYVGEYAVKDIKRTGIMGMNGRITMRIGGNSYTVSLKKGRMHNV